VNNNSIFSLAGKTVLVTGASSGFGAHFAKVLGLAGAQVVVAARRRERLDALVTELHSLSVNAVAVTMDITSQASVKAAFDEAEKALGQVNVLINNAGVSSELKRFMDMSAEDWDFVMDTNVKAAVTVSREFCGRLIAAKCPGVVVNIASIYGLATGLLNAPYNVSKAAVVQLSKSMAIELQRSNIRVNALCPGYFMTEMNDEFFSSEAGKRYIKSLQPGRLGEMSELDGPILLLASDASSYMTGSVVVVDGATVLKPV
jgi:NAD(P)-dependent dehydrogenase (short-subunit alcohol dehydrogenase family)